MAVLVSDSFNRADNSSSLGTTDSYNGGTAKTWTVLGGTYGISSNQAYEASAVSTNDGQFTYVDVGQSDVSYTMTLATKATGSPFFTVRGTGVNFHIMLQAKSSGYFLYSYNNGTYTTLGSYTTAVPVSGDVINIICQGTSITVKINGTQRISVTSSFNQTGTLFGFSGGGSTGSRFDNFEVDDLNAGGGSGTTYTGSGTAQGSSSATGANTLLAQASGNAQGISSVSSNEIKLYAASGLTQGLSNVSGIASLILNALGTAQGQSNVTANETKVYSASGSAQGLSNVAGNEQVIYLSGGNATGLSTVTANETLIHNGGTTYSGSGISQGGSNVLANEQMIYYATGTAQGMSAISAHEIIVLMASGIAQGCSSVTVVDQSNQIIGRIQLKGQRDLYVYLQGSRDMTAQLKGSRDLTINLKGSL